MSNHNHHYWQTSRLLLAIVFLYLSHDNKAFGQLIIQKQEDFQIGLSTIENNPSDSIILIESSSDLINWRDYIQSLTPLDNYPVSPLETSGHFFRLKEESAGTFNDWTNALDLINDDLFSQPSPQSNNGIRFLKFTIREGGDGQVLFQNSAIHPFHYQFARVRMPEVKGMSPQEYFRRSLYNENQIFVLGSLLLSPDENIPEIGIQFSGGEAFPSRRRIRWIKNVLSKIKSNHSYNFLYMPSIEQLEQTNQDIELFGSEGILVSDFTRWISEDICYSNGWTIGKIKFIKGSEITKKFLDGTITEKDILLTDILPSDIPRFSGIILKEPAGPNSHAIILAKSQGVPVGYYKGEGINERLENLINKTVFYFVDSDCQLTLKDLTQSHSEEEINSILETKEPPKAQIKAKKSLGKLFKETQSLSPMDIVYFGGKASNMGILNQSIAEHSPAPAIAISFDLWDQFMERPFRLSESNLSEAISNELMNYAHPPKVDDVHKSLYFVRRWIKETSFSPSLKAQIIAGLSEFDPSRKIRFRSSTNVEDSDTFSGAGLYDSFSGCLADDLDNDDEGPSHCDPFQENERGVFRAIKRVYASFYNDNAYLERLRHEIDETEVGMSILIHYSFPDENELSNGVLTVDYSLNDGEWNFERMEIVTHPGSESVANPDNSIFPEITTWSPDQLWNTEQFSSLSQTGVHAMSFPEDYSEIKNLTEVASKSFIVESGETNSVELDLEFKKMRGSGIIIKQIRKVPPPYRAPVPDL